MCQPYQYNAKLTENGILYVSSCKIRKQTANIKFQKQPPRGVPRKGVLKICSKFTEEHPCRSAVSIKLRSNFFEIAHRHG